MTIQGVASWTELEPLDRARNRMKSVGEFIRRWDNPALARRDHELHSSAFGNRNNSGEPDQPSAPDVTPHDHVILDGVEKEWRESLEDGVRWLVPLIIARFECVTYSSCGGHRRTAVDMSADPPQLVFTDARPVEREVQVVARSHQDADRLAYEMSGVMSKIELWDQSTVTPELRSELLLSLDTGTRWPAITFRLAAARGTWEEYFGFLETATATSEAIIGEGVNRSGWPFTAAMPRSLPDSGLI